MPSGPIRRAQLIAPFGVGAMVVVPGGISLIAGGLDHWYEYEDRGPDSRGIDLDEFRVEEWRLQELLGVNHFRMPPDYRRKYFGEEAPNLYLTVPFLRFPQWHFCWRCHLLNKEPLTARGRIWCQECQANKRRSHMAQVPFVAMCEYGHLQDFPWREWVHQSITAMCEGPLRLRATGGATLAAQRVECDRCRVQRTLAQITEGNPDGTTYLSNNLSRDKSPYLCQGMMPWHGSETSTECGRPVRGSLRSASNAYFAIVRSAIYLPKPSSKIAQRLREALTTPPLSTYIRLCERVGELVTPVMLREQQRDLLHPYSDEEIGSALKTLASQAGASQDPPGNDNEPKSSEDIGEIEFRRQEYSVLCSAKSGDQLKLRALNLLDYEPNFSQHFGLVVLVDQLRETRALVGFNRVFPEGPWNPRDRRAMLWAQPPDWKDSWLPAYVVSGEAIYLGLDRTRLAKWETRANVLERVGRLEEHYRRVQRRRHLRDRQITPRFVLLHTLSHVIMNELTFECGYSSAALRERLYVSAEEAGGMAGILIYTAAGDSEGTMGGLVRMGKPGYLESTFYRAIDKARWCSSDPICMEIGEMGQGPDSCNLAACHNCSLVPETACEEFNRFLDRGLLVGTLEDREVGFFHTGSA
jgi:hypothetical protein